MHLRQIGRGVRMTWIFKITPTFMTSGYEFADQLQPFLHSACALRRLAPVRFPPGLFMLATRFNCTGSLPVRKTVGTELVASRAAIAEALVIAAMRSTLLPRNNQRQSPAGERNDHRPDQIPDRDVSVLDEPLGRQAALRKAATCSGRGGVLPSQADDSALRLAERAPGAASKLRRRQCQETPAAACLPQDHASFVCACKANHGTRN